MSKYIDINMVLVFHIFGSKWMPSVLIVHVASFLNHFEEVSCFVHCEYVMWIILGNNIMQRIKFVLNFILFNLPRFSVERDILLPSFCKFKGPSGRGLRLLALLPLYILKYFLLLFTLDNVITGAYWFGNKYYYQYFNTTPASPQIVCLLKYK